MAFEYVLMDDLIDEISMGPFGSDVKVEYFVDSGVPVINGSNLTGFEMNENDLRFMDEERVQKMSKALARPGDVIITHRGTLGQAVYVPNTVKYPAYLISQSQFRVRFNENVVPEYVVFYLHSREGNNELVANSSQVGVPSLARPTSTFRQLRIPLPSLKVQQTIVSLISTLNCEISLLSKINDNLQHLLRSLYPKSADCIGYIRPARSCRSSVLPTRRV